MAVASLAGGLAATFARNVPPAFFSAPAQDRILRVAAALPGDATDFFGFECRLGGAAPESDFLVCVERGAFAGALAEGLRAHPPSVDPFWVALAGFCDALADAGGPLHALVHNLWLEFDLAGLPEEGPVPLPSVFVGTESLAAGADPALADAICDALDRLAGIPPAPARRSSLRRALAALPPGGSLFQIGLMLSRGDARIRICAKGMRIAAIEAYLSGLAGAAVTLPPLAAEAERRCVEVRIGFDAGAHGVGDRVGLECYCSGEDGAEERWPAFQDFLLAHDLALPAEVAALTGWSALIHRRLVDARAGAWLDGHPGRVPGPTDAGLHRSLHHVKLTLEPGTRPAAKAYLAAQPVWIPSGRLAALVRGAPPASPFAARQPGPAPGAAPNG